MIYSCQVIRKHILINKTYILKVYDNKILIGLENRQPAKYELEISFANRINWKINEQGQLLEFGIKYQNRTKFFAGSPNELLQIRNLIQNRIFINGISAFYSSQEMIGSGASCKVITIQETTTRKRYAAKCISKEYITKKKTPDRLNRLHNEISILRAIENHEHLVKLYDIFEGEQTYYLVFEYLEGETLHRYLKQQNSPIPEEKIRIIISQLLQGINYLHSLQYVHRDIKLENIVLCSLGDTSQLKIIDFGLAVSTTVPTPFAVCGTPGYIAPEILQHDDNSKNHGKFKFTPKVDMFGIGVILYRLMTRHPLFESDKTKELLSMNKKCNFTKIFIDGYTKELNFILMGLLDVNPIKRFSSEEAIRFLSSQSIKEISCSFTTTKSHQIDYDDFEIEHSQDSANQPYTFPKQKKLKVVLENSYHQNDDCKGISTQRSYLPSFSIQFSQEFLDVTQQLPLKKDEIIEPDDQQFKEMH